MLLRFFKQISLPKPANDNHREWIGTPGVSRLEQGYTRANQSENNDRKDPASPDDD